MQESILQALAGMKETTPAVVEAYLTLIADVNAILGNDWNDTPMEEVKRRFNYAVQRSLNIAI